jgi:hypothetical protein
MRHARSIAWGTLLAAVGCGQGVPGTRLASFEGIAQQLFATSGHVVWLEGIRGSLLRAPLAGGVAEIVPGVERVIQATQDGDDLYVTTGIEEMQPIVRVSTVGSAAPTRVATSERHVRALVARDIAIGSTAPLVLGPKSLYWGDDGRTRIAEAPRAGGASKITVSDVNTIIPSLAVRDRFLYFALDSGCNSRPWNKPCESELASRAHVFRLPIQ